ncbi:MAG: hypothetical protein MJZ35_07710 [Bacteroidaceae bacterium]|nr:hypothetical protein [Bacteroidaceae bacterium]
MSLFTKILIGWIVFDVVAYLIMWFDTKERNLHIKEAISSMKESMRNIKDSFTQDE